MVATVLNLTALLKRKKALAACSTIKTEGLCYYQSENSPETTKKEMGSIEDGNPETFNRKMPNGFQWQCSWSISRNQWSGWIRTAFLIAELKSRWDISRSYIKQQLLNLELWFILFTWEPREWRFKSQIDIERQSYKTTSHCIWKYGHRGRKMCH